MARVVKALGALMQPKVVLSLAASAAVIAALLAFGDAARVVGLLVRLRPGPLLAFAACLGTYELLRGAQWCFLLRALRVRAPLRAQVVAFVLGELVKDVPAGAFVQNYVLQESRGAGFAHTSAATVVVLACEVGVALLAAAVLGTGTWLRPAALIALALAGGLATLSFWLVTAGPRSPTCGIAARLTHAAQRLPWIGREAATRRFARGVEDTRSGLIMLFTPHALACYVSAAIACELLAGGALFALLRGLGESRLPFPRVLAAHGFGVAVALALPLPIDFGALEVSGVAALLALGLAKSTAVAVMVLNRALSIVVTLLVAAVVVAAVPSELRRAWESRRGMASPAPTALRRPRRRAGL